VVDNVQIGEVITDMAKREKVDLIFLGLKKLSKVGKFLFGSNAQYIILRAPCPVVSVTRLAIDKA
jgi:nucleotide-binding universal stress UspA family protein